MIDPAFLVYEILIFLCTLLSFFFSGTETAMVSSNRLKLSALSDRGNVRAGRSLKILDRIEDNIGMTLIGNNIVNITATVFITYLATQAFSMGDTGMLAVSAVQTVFFLIFCEVFPKVIARSAPERFLMLFSFLITILSRMLMPAIRLSLLFTSLLKKSMGYESTRYSMFRSRDEMDHLFKISEEEGLIGKHHHAFLSEILTFHQITANEIMTPTIDIVSIEICQPVRDLIRLIETTRFSRIPVYRDRVDNIIGHVYYRDLLAKKNIRSIEEITYRAHYVPRTKRIFELFNEMQEENIPVVFVVNEYGAVEGLVTPEDIAEEIVGEIQTRDHPEQDIIRQISDGEFLVDGNLDIEFFERRFGISVKKKGFETVAGYLCYSTGRIPRKGETFILDRIRFKIEEATEKSVERVRITIEHPRKK